MAKAKKKKREDQKYIARNRRARYEYEVLDTLECGIALIGPEVLEKLHISPYEAATRENAEPMRERKLLAHRHQIEKLRTRVVERGLTLVPLSLYFKEGRVKVEIALVRGKRMHDRREDIKRRDADREADRAMRGRRDP